VLLGENAVPYRVLPPREAVLPLEGSRLLDSDDPHLGLYPGLAEWWGRAEQLWDAHRSSERLTLRARLDFRRGLSAQLPPAALRLVYGKAGMHVAAAVSTRPTRSSITSSSGELSPATLRARISVRSSTAPS
jgi:hypothetical protein